MNHKTKKILKYTSMGIVLLIATISLAIGIALNIFFTPEKITPIVIHALNKNLNAELVVESIEITFFSSFPNFSLEMEKGALLHKLQPDTLQTDASPKQDSLIAFDKCQISLNPIAFLQNNEISVQQIAFDKPRIYAFVNKAGTANWNILKETEEDSLNIEADTTQFKADFSIEDITLTDADLIYDDRNTQLYARMEGLDLSLEALYNEKTVLLGIEMETQKVTFWQKGEALANNIPIGLSTHLSANRETKILDIGESKVRINDIAFTTQGQLIPDKEKRQLGMNLDLNLEVPSLTNLLNLIPKEIWKQEEDFKPIGQLSFHAKISGNYGNGQMPIVDTRLGIKKGGIEYLNKGEVERSIRNIELGIEGQLTPNAEKRRLEMNLGVNLEAPSLETIMMLVPEDILKRNKDLTTKGQLSFKAKVTGNYGKEEMPTVDARLSLKNGGIQYKDMPNKIELLETDITTFIDLARKKTSSVTIKNLKIKGLSTHLELSGKASNVWKNPKITSNAKGFVDFEALAKTLPLSEGIDAHGRAEIDLNGTFFTNDILKSDYGKIDAAGNIKLTNVKLAYKTDSLVFEAQSSTAIFGQNQSSKRLTPEESRLFGGKIDLSGINLVVKNQLKASLDQVSLSFGSTPWKDSSQIATVKSNLKLKNARINLADTLKGMIGNVNAIINLNPSAKDRSIPTIHTEFQIDSTGLTANGNFIGIKEGKYNFDLIRKAPKRWPATGYISFNSLYAYTPMFPLLLKMPQTKVSIRPGLIELNKAKIVIGKSDIEITGKIHDLEKTLLEKKTLKAELAVNSALIDANELIKTLNEGVTLDDSTLVQLASEEKIESTPDSTSLKTFIVPKRIDFTFESKFDKVIFGDLEINDIYGLIQIKNQNIRLVDLRMKTLAADMATSIRYSAKTRENASIDFDFGLTDIDIKKLVQLMPALDTLFPMANSFEGDVNFKMQGKSQLNTEMAVDLPTFQAIARIEGQDLILLDGKTFSELSKMLMFKNKERNLIDSLSFEMVVQGNIMNVFPSLITVDRYKVAVGGQHKLDMTYNYHVSVLKSPMPFKAGIDLIGDLEDYDFKITKAKYKYLFSQKEKHQAKADSSILKIKAAILEKLKF